MAPLFGWDTPISVGNGIGMGSGGSGGGDTREGRGRRDADNRGLGFVLRREGLAVLGLLGPLSRGSFSEEPSSSSYIPGTLGVRDRRGAFGDATEFNTGRRAFGGGGD